MTRCASKAILFQRKRTPCSVIGPDELRRLVEGRAGVLAKIEPDVICVDNVILFPAIKRYAEGLLR